MAGRVVVAHHSWGPDGETEFNVALVKSLCSLGLRVGVAGVTASPGPVRARLSGAGCVDSEKYLVPFHVPAFTLY